MTPDQFRRSQIYTPPPPPDSPECKPPFYGDWCYPTEYWTDKPQSPRGLGRKWLPAGWLVYGALLFLAGFLAHVRMKP